MNHWVLFAGIGGDGKRLDHPPAELAPLQTARSDGLDAGSNAAARRRKDHMPGLLIGTRKPIDLVRSGKPGLRAGLHEAVPVAEGDVVEVVAGQPGEIDEVGLCRMLLVVGLAGKVLGAAMGE
ncbi:MAG: hypothetical protein WCQ21_18545, partial [Verrucomicrobiota bacterium]